MNAPVNWDVIDALRQKHVKHRHDGHESKIPEVQAMVEREANWCEGCRNEWPCDTRIALMALYLCEKVSTYMEQEWLDMRRRLEA